MQTAEVNWLEKVRRHAQPTEISRTDSDGVEIVFCEDDASGEYVGWTTREFADRNRYTVKWTEGDPVKVCLVEVAEFAEALLEEMGGVSPDRAAVDTKASMLRLALENARREVLGDPV